MKSLTVGYINMVMKKLHTLFLVLLIAKGYAMQSCLPADYLPLKSDGICHLALIPIEIQNHIASFLQFKDRESDEHYFKRIDQVKRIPDECYKQMFGPSVEGITPLGALITYSTNCSKIILLEKNYSRFKQCNLPKLTILDITSNSVIRDTKINELFVPTMKSIQSIGLCAKGILIGCLEELITQEQSEKAKESYIYMYQVTLYNINTQEKRTIPLFETKGKKGFMAILHFNMQTTKVTMCTNNSSYIAGIVPEAEHNQKTIKTLKDYFIKIKPVCNDIQKSVPEGKLV